MDTSGVDHSGHMALCFAIVKVSFSYFEVPRFKHLEVIIPLRLGSSCTKTLFFLSLIPYSQLQFRLLLEMSLWPSYAALEN